MAGAAARLALAYRRQQALIAARLVQQVALTWRHLVNPANVDGSWPVLRSLLESMVRSSRAQSAALAREFYMQQRRDAGIPDGLFRPPHPSVLEQPRLETSLDVTGPVEFKKAISAGRTPPQAVDAAAVRMSGSMQYLALEGGRDVITSSIARDERALGWARVTDADPCAWCAMLASRGPVYKSAKTAGDPRQGGNSYHDHCGCAAVPTFSHDEPFIGAAETLYNDWLKQTSGTSGKDAVNAFRRWWEAEGRANYQAPSI